MAEHTHYRKTQKRLAELLKAELLGMGRGLIADGKVNQDEAEALLAFLEAQADVPQEPLALDLREQVRGMLEDGVLDEEERVRLYDTLSQLVGGEQVLGECLRATTLPLDDPVPEVEFEGRKFCLTGNFSGDRRDCAARIKVLGGMIQTTVSGKTDYLVIGEYASPAWKQSSYGGKIEKAVELKRMEKGIRVISEQWLRECLLKSKNRDPL